MTRLILLVALVAAGYLVAWTLHIHGLEESGSYRLAATVLLAVGLYGSTAGIDLRIASANLRTILLATTVGVLLKAALIGTALALILRDPSFLILGVVVAQIDPLSVASIMGDTSMSERARSILASWAAFDDPVTVMLTLSATMMGTRFLGPGVSDGVAPLGAYAVTLGENLGFAAVVYVLWLAIRRRAWLAHAVLGAMAMVAVWRFWMLGFAISGLFMRPAIADRMLRVTQGAMLLGAFLLGMLLIDGVDLRAGLLLGLAACVAQVLVTLPLTIGLPGNDRVHLAFAQQNGITAMVLALLLESEHRGVIGIVAPAILVTNFIHLVANGIVERYVVKPSAVKG
ncbi:MAG: hypothetical protein ACREN8_09555 [Candidatus Dormibacteraceae bacterium]